MPEGVVWQPIAKTNANKAIKVGFIGRHYSVTTDGGKFPPCLKKRNARRFCP